MSKTGRDIEQMCRYCEHAVPVYDDDTVLCIKRGIVGKAFCCKKFVYDPLKRNPSATPKIPSLEYIDIDKD